MLTFSLPFLIFGKSIGRQKAVQSQIVGKKSRVLPICRYGRRGKKDNQYLSIHFLQILLIED